VHGTKIESRSDGAYASALLVLNGRDKIPAESESASPRTLLSLLGGDDYSMYQ